MTRKMLKEERALRKFYSVAYPSEAAEIKRDFKKMLSALVAACYEDAAKIVESKDIETDASGKWEKAHGGKDAMKKLADAIRGKK